jgi:hypothetical protein
MLIKKNLGGTYIIILCTKCIFSSTVFSIHSFL